LKPERKGLVKPFLALAMVATLLLNTLAFLPMHRAVGTFPGLNGKIAFTSIRDGNEEIYVMNADGTDQTRLTNNPAGDWNPDWSPDGTRIAFNSNRESGQDEIYVMNPDGSGVTDLTNNPASDGSPTWSPDGTKHCSCYIIARTPLFLHTSRWVDDKETIYHDRYDIHDPKG